jgi:hypothetical protein
MVLGATVNNLILSRRVAAEHGQSMVGHALTVALASFVAIATLVASRSHVTTTLKALTAANEHGSSFSVPMSYCSFLSHRR